VLADNLRNGLRGVRVGDAGGRGVDLTGREWEVLVLLRQDRTTGDIARHLVISRVTVRTHVAALVHKLGVGGRAGLLAPYSDSRDEKDQRPLMFPARLEPA
jgi:DNA-binding CsgD family transcriptional regulator